MFTNRMLHRLRPGAWLTAVLAAAIAASASAAQPGVHDAWARATPPGVTTGAVYLTIAGGDEPDRLVDVESDAAEAAELHTELNDGGVLTMKKLDFLPIASNERVALEPGHDHIMLMGLKGPLRPGQTIGVTLTFEHAGKVAVEVPVRDARSSSSATRGEHSKPASESTHEESPGHPEHGGTQGAGSRDSETSAH